MHDTTESDPVPRKSEWASCLTRTRTAVLNVLIGVALMIAVSGWVLRGRARAEPPAKSQRLHEVLMAALIVLAVASYLVRRVRRRMRSAIDPARRQALFYRSHLAAAAIASLAAPLGLIYGLWIDPRIEAVIPFWVISLALGLLAFPRVHELEDFDRTPPDPGASSS